MAREAGRRGRHRWRSRSQLLEDEALAAPVVAAIGEGVAADEAWRSALDLEIEGYVSSDDEYFRARASRSQGRARPRAAGTSPASATARSRRAGRSWPATMSPPTLFLETDWSGGGGDRARRLGSPSSHVAMLARARGIPMVVGLGDVELDGHAEAIVDGESGRVVLSPGAPERSAFDGAVRAWAAAP